MASARPRFARRSIGILRRGALLSGSLLAIGCQGGDRRPWAICHRIYDQCRSAIGALTQAECEAAIARRPPAEIATLFDCVRDNFCEKFGATCKQPIRRRPGL
jgi:hypothetical protein